MPPPSPSNLRLNVVDYFRQGASMKAIPLLIYALIVPIVLFVSLIFDMWWILVAFMILSAIFEVAMHLYNLSDE
jgi:hypothetical protein